MKRVALLMAIAGALALIAPGFACAQNAAVYDIAPILPEERGQFLPIAGDPGYGSTFYDADGWYLVTVPPGGEMVAVNASTRKFVIQGARAVSLMVAARVAPDFVDATPADLDSVVNQMMDPATEVGRLIAGSFPPGSTLKSARPLELVATNKAKKSPRLASFEVAMTSNGQTRDTIFAYLPSNRGLLQMHCSGELDDCRRVITLALRLGEGAFIPDPSRVSSARQH